MDKRSSALSMIMNSLPLLLALGALLLFAVGYGAHNLWGDNNPLEEIAEELLKKDYNIEVEFSNATIK
jgi:hypothetical protein